MQQLPSYLTVNTEVILIKIRGKQNVPSAIKRRLGNLLALAFDKVNASSIKYNSSTSNNQNI